MTFTPRTPRPAKPASAARARWRWRTPTSTTRVARDITTHCRRRATVPVRELLDEVARSEAFQKSPVVEPGAAERRAARRTRRSAPFAESAAASPRPTPHAPQASRPVRARVRAADASVSSASPRSGSGATVVARAVPKNPLTSLSRRPAQVGVRQASFVAPASSSSSSLTSS